MQVDSPNHSAWRQLQVLINANKVEKCNFSKTLEEKVEVMTAKMIWRNKMRLEHPGWTKKHHHQIMRQSGKV